VFTPVRPAAGGSSTAVTTYTHRTTGTTILRVGAADGTTCMPTVAVPVDSAFLPGGGASVTCTVTDDAGARSAPIGTPSKDVAVRAYTSGGNAEPSGYGVPSGAAAFSTAVIPTGASDRSSTAAPASEVAGSRGTLAAASGSATAVGRERNTAGGRPAGGARTPTLPDADEAIFTSTRCCCSKD